MFVFKIAMLILALTIPPVLHASYKDDQQIEPIGCVVRFKVPHPGE
jgi:hypothetical protein